MIYKIGHAGAAGHAPANTLISIKKALEIGADMIEFDVRRCKSGEVVVIHDEKVNRTTNGMGRVKDLTLAQLKQLKVIEPFGENKIIEETIPTLEEVLDAVNRRAEVNIEIKDADAASSVADIVKLYINKKEWGSEDFLVSSFDVRALEILKSADTGVRLGVLAIISKPKTVKSAQKLYAYSIHTNFSFISEKFVRTAHKQGFAVFVYTVNESSDINKMKVIGVDGIFSDYPERI